MAGLFKSFVDAGKSAMDKYLNSSDPNLVKAVNPKDYAPVPVQVSTYHVPTYILPMIFYLK